VSLVEEEGEVVGALPYFLKRKGPFRYIGMPHLTRYMGPLLLPRRRTPSDERKLFGVLIAHLPAVHGFEQEFHPGVQNWLPFHWEGFAQSTRYTYVLQDLSDPEELAKRLNRSHRRAIRKGDAHLRLEEDLPLERLRPLVEASFRRKGLAVPFPWEVVERLHAALRPRGCHRIIAALDPQGQPLAGGFFLWNQQTCFYLFSGVLPEARQWSAGIWLLWQAILIASRLGLERFDFLGSMLPGVEEKNRAFGARQQPYFRIWKHSSRLLHWLRCLRGKP